MSEPEIGRKIGQMLDRGLDDMKQSTLNRLQAARRASLENYHMAEATVGVGQGAFAHGHDWHNRTRKLLIRDSLAIYHSSCDLLAGTSARR